MAIDILNRYTGAVLATIPGFTLSGISFSGLNISNADLANKDLSASTFIGCNLSGSTLQGSNCLGTSFFRSNVQGCDLRGIQRNAASNFGACFFEDVLLDVADQNVSAWVLPSLLSGQSNAQSTQAGAIGGLPDPTIPFNFVNAPFSSSGGLWTSLQIDPVTGDHGSEIVFAQTLKALGLKVMVCKLTQGATTMTDWQYGSISQWTTILQPGMIAAVNGIQALFPGEFIRWSLMWYLGEDDARSNGLGGTTYGGLYLSFLIGLSGLVGQNVWKRNINARTQSWLANAKATPLADCRRWETELGATFLNTDDLAHIADNVHLTIGSQDILGARWASAYQTLLASQVP